MTIKIGAVYRDGVFQPSTPPPISEGAEVELVVTTADEPGSLADALEEIARTPVEATRDGFSGADHDGVLYSMKQDGLTAT
jgi:predicted DNA-binding antitoxin AbrB/MazE fold protein